MYVCDNIIAGTGVFNDHDIYKQSSTRSDYGWITVNSILLLNLVNHLKLLVSIVRFRTTGRRPSQTFGWPDNTNSTVCHLTCQNLLT